MRQWRDLMKKHNKLRLAVSKGEKAKAQKRTEKLFRKDPHKFAQNVFRKKEARAPTFSKAVAQEFYTRTYHDADREHMYEAMPEMVRPQAPVSPFNTEAPTLKEVQEIVHHKRNAAAPGPNGIPYTVYKKCPSILKKLHEIFLRIWKDGDIPDNWGVGFISLISKSEVCDDPEEFRPIAVTNTSGKIFLSIVSKRLERYLVSNKYLERQTQKGFLEGVSGCVEHAFTLWEALREAKEEQRSLVVSWIDLANA